MENENNKIRKKKEFKDKVSSATIKKLIKATVGYGKLRDFSDKAKLDYNTVYAVRTTALATPSTKAKIEKALKAA